MKKFTVLCLSCFLFLAFSADVYCQEKAPALEFKASGMIRTYSVLKRNVPTAPPSLDLIYGPPDYPPGPTENYFSLDSSGRPQAALNKTEAFMQSTLYLRFDASMGKEITGTIWFEADSSKWGERSSATTNANNGTMGQWDADRTAVEIKNVFVNFGVPVIPVPTTMSVGIQANQIRPGVFFNVDGPGITIGIKPDPAFIKLLWAKPLENQTWSADDVDVYGVEANFKIDKITVGGYGSFWDFNSYGLGIDTAIGSRPSYRADFYWYGVYADGTAGPVNFNFDLVFDKGKVEDRATPSNKDVKYNGWMTRAKINFPWDKFNFGVIGMYASGADTNKTSKTGVPGIDTTNGYTTPNTKVKSYVIPPQSKMGYVDSLCYYASWINAHGAGWFHGSGDRVAGGDYGGTWFAKVYGNFKPTPWYKVTLEALYIGDTTKHGNTVGTAEKASGRLRDDKTIGWEIDLFNEFQIYKNLTWNVGAGILFAGDAMDYNVSGATNKSIKDPWIIHTALTYNF
jgi:hypothetical protein